MQDILIKAACYAAIILLGFILRKTGFFGPEAFGVLSKVVLKITLPCAVLTSTAGKEVDFSMLVILLMGLGCGAVYMLVGALVYRKQGKDKQAFAIVNTSGYNIGTFSLPFTQSFLGSVGVVATSLFDMGNAMVCLGGSYGIAASVREGRGFDLKRIGKAIVKSVPFLTYCVMLILNLLHLSPPGPIVSFARIAGSGNAFLAMLMIGVGFNLSGDKSQIGSIVKILSVRYGLAAVFALVIYFLLPFELEIRQTLVLLVFSPIGSAAPVFTAELKGDVGLASALNSIAILVSLVIMVVLLIVML